MVMSDTARSSESATPLESVRRQVVSLLPIMVAIYTPIVVLFAVVIVIRLRTGIAIAEFTRDPLGFTGIPVYTGSISNLGIMIWSAAAAVSLFGYGVSRWQGTGGHTRPLLLVAGLVTLVLTLDDLFMLHEVVLPDLGVPQNLVYATHAVMLVGFVAVFWRTILRTPWVLLVLAYAGFGFTVFADFLAPLVTIPGMYVFEDGSKLFGIVSWCAWLTMVSAHQITMRR